MSGCRIGKVRFKMPPRVVSLGDRNYRADENPYATLVAASQEDIKNVFIIMECNDGSSSFRSNRANNAHNMLMCERGKAMVAKSEA